MYDTYQRIDKNELPKLEKDIKTLSAKLTETSKGVDKVFD